MDNNNSIFVQAKINIKQLVNTFKPHMYDVLNLYTYSK